MEGKASMTELSQTRAFIYTHLCRREGLGYILILTTQSSHIPC